MNCVLEFIHIVRAFFEEGIFTTIANLSGIPRGHSVALPLLKLVGLVCKIVSY